MYSSAEKFYVSRFSGYEDSLKSLHRSNASNELTRGHELLAAGNDQHHQQLTSNSNTVGRRNRLHSFSNLEASMYTRDTTLQRDTRYRANTEKRTRNHTTGNNSLTYDRSLPDGLNISRTMIRERSNTVTDLPSNNQNALRGEINFLD